MMINKQRLIGQTDRHTDGQTDSNAAFYPGAVVSGELIQYYLTRRSVRYNIATSNIGTGFVTCPSVIQRPTAYHD